MKRFGTWTARSVTLLAVAAVLGCQTYGESAGLGGLIGAAAGAVIGNQSGEAGEGAIIGAAVGAAVGAIAKDVEVRNEYEREMAYEQQRQSMEPVLPPQDSRDAETLVLEDMTVLPAVVRTGDVVEVSIRYGVYNADEGVRIKETRTLYKDGREIEVFSSNVIYRANGSWLSPQQFRVASRLEPGVYEVVQVVASENAMINGRANFRIE